MRHAIDPELAAAKARIRDAISSFSAIDSPATIRELDAAIEALVDVKIAIAIEMMADRMEQASGLRP